MKRLSFSIKCLPLLLTIAICLVRGASPLADETSSKAFSSALSDRANKRFVIASSNNFPPINQLDEDDELIGFGKDISDAVVAAIGGTQSRIHSSIWADVLKVLAEGQADFIHDTGYSEERTAFLDYSEPILTMPEEIFVRVDRFNISSLKTLEGLKVACVNNHITHLYLKTLPGIKCHIVSTPVDGLYALLNGNVDAFIFPRQILLHIAQRLQVINRIKAVGKPVRELKWHMTVRKGDQEMLWLLNQGIAKIKESGRYEEIYDYWFGRTQSLGYSKKEMAVFISFAAVMSLAIGALLVFFYRMKRMSRMRKELKDSLQGLEQSERSLRNSQKRLRDFANSSSDWFWETDENDVFTYVSDHYEKMTGIGAGILLGKPYRETKPLSIGDETWGGIQEDMTAHREFRDFIFSIFRLNGELVWISANGVPFFDADNKFLGYRGTGSNITRQKRIEEARLKTERLFQSIVDNTPTSLHLKDTEGRFQVVNKSFENWYGLSTEQVLGKTSGELFDEPFADNFEKQDKEVLESGQMRARELEVRFADGKIHPIYNIKFPVFDDDGKITGIGTIVTDLTEYHLLEAEARSAQASSAIKSTFLANMSHEIRTPMNGVIGMAEILSHSDLSSDQSRQVQTILNSSQSLLRVIDDILDMSKIEAGKLDIEYTETNVKEAAEDIAVVMAPGADEKNVRLQLIIDPSTPERIISDPVRLRQVLNNLMSNAIKFSCKQADERKGQVHLKLDSPKSGSLRLQVIDDGIGMSEETVENLFQPFSQAESSTTRRFGGSGLGLSITNDLVELMGGSIIVDSKLGEGTTFTVTLPCEVLKNKESSFDFSDVQAFGLFDEKATPDILSASKHLQGRWNLTIADDEAEFATMIGESKGPVIAVLALGTMAENNIVRSQYADPSDRIRFLCQTYDRFDKMGPIALDCFVISRFPTLPSELIRGISVLMKKSYPDTETPREENQTAKSNTAKQYVARILLVEDNETNQEVISMQVKMLGHEVEVAENGIEGLDKWKAGDFDLVLTDCHMPKMDGFEMTEAIRNAEKQASSSRVSIVAITANALQGESENCLAVGMNDYLSKPVKLKRLDETLKRWLPKESGDAT